MVDTLLAAIVFAVIVAVGLAGLAAVTLVPFVLALQMADARRFSTARWGAVTLAGSLLGLAVAAYVVLRTDRSSAFALLGLPFAFLGPGVLWLLEEQQSRIGGRAGAHE